MCAARAHHLIQKAFKIRAVALKTIGVHIRQVVGDDLHLGLLGIQTGLGNVHGACGHLELPLSGSFLQSCKSCASPDLLLCYPHDLCGGLVDLLCGFDEFHAHLKAALQFDCIDQLFDGIDV